MDKYIQEIFEAQNTLRTDPTHFVPYLEEMAQSFRGKRYRKPGAPTIVTNEGAKAVFEAIDFLNQQKPIHALTLSEKLGKAAQDHADDTEANGFVGHTGSDGSSMSDRIERHCQWSGTIGENCAYSDIYEGGFEVVLNLLIDDGVSNRGHRRNIFNTSFN